MGLARAWEWHDDDKMINGLLSLHGLDVFEDGNNVEGKLHLQHGVVNYGVWCFDD